MAVAPFDSFNIFMGKRGPYLFPPKIPEKIFSTSSRRKLALVTFGALLFPSLIARKLLA